MTKSSLPFLAALLVLVLWVSGCTSVGSMMMTREDRAASVSTPQVQPGEYRLDAGDIISIRVYEWRSSGAGNPAEEDLRLERIRLTPTGTVTLPFGEFKVIGQTAREFENAITDSLRGRLLRNPRVSVNIDEYRPFFVEGQVTRPGAYPYQPGLNVRKAVTIAGGFRERASSEKIFLVRERDGMNSRVRVDLNAPVGPGDTVTVEESFF